MTLRIKILVLILFIFNLNIKAEKFIQDYYQTKLIESNNDTARIIWLGKLVEYNLINKNFTKADSLYNIQLNIVTKHQSIPLNIIVLFNNIENSIYSFLDKKNYAISQKFVDNALKYSIQKKLKNYVSLAYLNKANLATKKGKFEEALNSIKYAELNTHNDSILLLIQLSKSNIFLKKNELLVSYKILGQALLKANKLNNHTLQSLIHHKMSNLYESLGDNDQALKSLNNSFILNQKTNNIDGLIQDYLAISRLNDYEIAQKYITKALSISKMSINYYKYILQAETYLFTFKMLKGNKAETLNYLNTNQILNQYHKNQGEGHYCKLLGQISKYSNSYDSALMYYKKAEPVFSKNYENLSKASFYDELSQIYKFKSMLNIAIDCQEIAFKEYSEFGTIKNINQSAKSLKNLYEEKKDYKNCLKYFNIYKNLSDSIQTLSKFKELNSLKIENEKKMETIEQEREEIKIKKKHSIQYVGITIVIAIAFFILILLGMFKVNLIVIEILGFFSVLFIFEFFVMLIDNYAHKYTHEEPLYIWIFKITLFSILLPLHHTIEKNVINYLKSRKLIEIQNIFSKKK